MDENLRIYPEHTDRDVVFRHIDRYLSCAKMIDGNIANKTLLDFGCGCGYGASILSNIFYAVVGYDLDKDAIQYANNRYKNSNVLFKTDLDNRLFDACICCEVIEHVFDATYMLDTIRSNLPVGGQLVIATPVVDRTGPSSVNPHHVKEYSNQDLIEIVGMAGFTLTNVGSYDYPSTFGPARQGFYRFEAI